MPVYVFVAQLSAPSVVFAINVFSDLDYEFVKQSLFFKLYYKSYTFPLVMSLIVIQKQDKG